MKPNEENVSVVSDIACWLTAVLFVVGLLVLAIRLREVQVVESAGYSYSNDRQSIRRVETPGLRGCIIDRNGKMLADNRLACSIAVNACHFQQRTWEATEVAISSAVERVALVIGKASQLTARDLHRHVRQSLAMPLVAWRDVPHEVLAKFCEHESELSGFICVDTEERRYPQGSTAAHLIGYVGRDRGQVEAGDVRFNFSQYELRGRSGVESYYDMYLRGVAGEKRVRVDARGFASEEWVVQEPRRGPDLKLSIDLEMQREAERQLKGLRGACVAIDPRNGEVLVLASAPTYNLNEFVPRLATDVYRRYAEDPMKPLLNRAAGGAYAPGSTFKPVVALAGLTDGFPPLEEYCCSGAFRLGQMVLRCTSRWGHGELDMRHAICKSCNPYFCNLGMEIGTNSMINAAQKFGLGAKTGIDFGVDVAGAVPNAEWKMRVYHEKWYSGDVAQMSIGQGMLLVSPLQMARLAGAIGTGYLVTPHLRLDMTTERHKLPFSEEHLRVVRDGMRMVVNEGSGRRGGEGVPVSVSGKTGTAEVGRGEKRYKNTWFIAFAPSENPRVAIAMVVEHGESGGGTTAPKVAAVLRTAFKGDK